MAGWIGFAGTLMVILGGLNVRSRSARVDDLVRVGAAPDFIGELRVVCCERQPLPIAQTRAHARSVARWKPVAET
jgi:hypothetical protein